MLIKVVILRNKAEACRLLSSFKKNHLNSNRYSAFQVMEVNLHKISSCYEDVCVVENVTPLQKHVSLKCLSSFACYVFPSIS